MLSTTVPHAARLEVGCRHEVQLVVSGGCHEQIAGEDVLLAQQGFVGDVSAQHAHVGEPFHRLTAKVGIPIDHNQLLVDIGGRHAEQSPPEGDVLLPLLSRQQQRAHAIGAKHDDAPQLRLRRLRVGDELRDVRKARDEADLVADGKRGPTVRQRGRAVDRLDESHKVAPAIQFGQFRERHADKLTSLADGKCRYSEIGIQFYDAADGTVFERSGNGVRRLDLRVEHAVDAVKRARCGHCRLRALPRHVRRRVVGIVPDPSDLLDARIYGVDERARDHVDLVVRSERNERVGRGDSGRLKRFQVVAVRLKHRAVQLVARVTHALRVVVDEDDVVPFQHERPRKLHACEASAYDKDLHG